MIPLQRFPRKLETRAVHLSIALALTIVVLTTVTGKVTPGSHLLLPSQQALPLDPLTPEEIELAARIASADPRVKKELGPGRQQLIQIQFFALKSGGDSKTRPEQKPLKPGRYAAVLFYRYDTDEGVNVVVDLTERSIGDITRLEGKAVPLALEEIRRAFALALLNRQVRTLLGPKASEFKVAGLSTAESPQNRVEGLRVVATSPRDPCYRHRCIELHFRKREGYVPATSVMVDLSAQKVKVQKTVR